MTEDRQKNYLQVRKKNLVSDVRRRKQIWKVTRREKQYRSPTNRRTEGRQDSACPLGIRARKTDEHSCDWWARRRCAVNQAERKLVWPTS